MTSLLAMKIIYQSLCAEHDVIVEAYSYLFI